MAYTEAQAKEVLELQAAGTTRNDIVRQTGVSAGSVHNIVYGAGRSFERKATEAATAARKADAAALRAALELDYLDDAQHFRQRARAEYLVFEWGGKDHEYAEKQLDEPPPVDQLKLMQASASASNSSIRIDAHTVGAATNEAGKSLIGDIMGALKLQPPPDDGTEPEDPQP